MRFVSALLIGGAILSSATAAFAQDIDWQKVDDAFGRKAAVTGDVHRYGFPRTDLTVTLDGVTIKPALALGGWVAFKPMGGEAMAMGDLVLLETEIKPVMTKMIENGLDITAVHNHLLRANPATFYMHVGGHGDPVKLATAIRTALAESKTPLTPPTAAAPPPAIDLDTAQLDQIIGVKGQANGGVYQFGVPRRDPVTMDGMAVAPAGPLGVATGIGFQPTGNGNAAITGDFVMVVKRGQSGHQSTSRRRHRGDRPAQPHAGRTAAALLHAFLGQRRRHQARQGAAYRLGRNGKRQKLTLKISPRRWAAACAAQPQPGELS